MSEPIHPLASSQAPVVLITSRPPLFCATIITTNKNIYSVWPPFFQSYGVNLPSSLTVHNSYALVHLYQPTCVGLQYGSQYLQLIRRSTDLEVFPEPLIQQIGSPKITFTSQLVFIYRSKNIFPDLPKKTNLLFEPQSNEGPAFSTTILHS
jgi:hypothetical protein